MLTAMSPTQAEYSPANIQVNLAVGARLMIIRPETIPGNDHLQAQYFEKVDQLEQGKYGLQRHGILSVDKVLLGNRPKPKVIALMSFPSQQKEEALMALPGWPAIKNFRRSIWAELLINSQNLPETVNWTFIEDRVYTFEYIWLSENVAASTNKIGFYDGGNRVAILPGDIYESLHDGDKAPSFIAINEWRSPQEFEQAFASENYREYIKQQSRISQRHEIYQARPQSNTLNR